MPPSKKKKNFYYILHDSLINKKHGQQEWFALTDMEYTQYISLLDFYGLCVQQPVNIVLKLPMYNITKVALK